MFRRSLILGLVSFWGLMGFAVGASASGATFPDLAGKWSFQGEVISSHKVETVVVRVAGEAGRFRLQELKSQKFSCTAVSSGTYRCTKPSSDSWTVPVEHLEEISSQMRLKSFEFVKVDGVPELITSGDSVKQWSLPLIAYAESGKTDAVIWWQSADVNKLEFEIDGEKLWPTFTDGSDLNFMVKIEEARGDLFAKYYYKAVFRREAGE